MWHHCNALMKYTFGRKRWRQKGNFVCLWHFSILRLDPSDVQRDISPCWMAAFRYQLSIQVAVAFHKSLFIWNSPHELELIWRNVSLPTPVVLLSWLVIAFHLKIFHTQSWQTLVVLICSESEISDFDTVTLHSRGVLVNRCLFHRNEPYLHQDVKGCCEGFIPDAAWSAERIRNGLFIQGKL